MQIFNQFFGVEYFLPKLDLVGLACLSVGAMENWGLVTFRENSLLVDPSTSSNAQLQAVTEEHVLRRLLHTGSSKCYEELQTA